MPVPVLEVAPRWFGAWARLVSVAEPQPAAVTTLPARPRRSAPPERERELPVAERVRRFLTTASPAAAELAAHVAVSVPSLPVMRLIQHRVLGRSGPGQLAEVLLSGLLRPAGGVRCEFVPGAREALLDPLPRPEASTPAASSKPSPPRSNAAPGRQPRRSSAVRVTGPPSAGRSAPARPPSKPGVPGRGVPVHRRRQRIIQVADVSPSPSSAM